MRFLFKEPRTSVFFSKKRYLLGPRTKTLAYGKSELDLREKAT